MTDKELWQAAWKELTLTTISYPKWKQQGFTAGHWANAKALGDQIGAADPPPTPPPPPTNLVELEGTFTPSTFAAAIGSATLVRPKAGKTVVVNGGGIVRNGVTFQNIVFDGQGQSSKIFMVDAVDWQYLGCTFRGFWVPDQSDHSQALFVGGGCARGLVDGCSFLDYGNTAAIFFTYFGSGPDSSTWWDQSRYPRDVRVQNCTFGAPHDFGPGGTAYFGVNMVDEIPLASNIRIQPGQPCAASAGLCRLAAFVR